jgi:hypothetical protein
MFSSSLHGESPHDDAKAWRAMTLMDLELVAPQQAFHAEIWNDLIARNNAAQAGAAAKTPRPLSIRNAPARAVFATVRSPQVVVVLSILGAPRLCEPLPNSTSVLRCPMRLIRFENGKSSMREGQGCFAVGKPGSNEPAAYASYDTSARMIRLGVLTGSSAVEGCSQSVPVKESE